MNDGTVPNHSSPAHSLHVSAAGVLLEPDGGGRGIRAFNAADDGRLRREHVFACLITGVADGLKTNETGCVYAATANGIRIRSTTGEPLRALPTASTCGNWASDGAEGRTLFICNDRHVHVLPTRVRDAAWA